MTTGAFASLRTAGSTDRHSSETQDSPPGFHLDARSQIHQTTANILIVDDEARICSAYRVLLAGEHRRIEECANGNEAIARLQQRDIDIVILDLNLPDIGGREIMEWLEHNRISTSIIVFSADDTIDAAILALRRGACEFIRKNSDPEELVRTVSDVLRRRHLEHEHATMAARLDESERLHRFLVDNSPDIIYTLDAEGRFVFINRRIESLLGYAPNELVGQKYWVIVDEADRERARYAFAERRAGARATTNQEVRLRCKHDGTVLHFENRAIVAILSAQGVYRSDDGTPDKLFMGTTGVLRDITERKKAEETITFQAFHDLLTGLPNRVLFRDRLELAINQARRHQRKVGLMYMDIDRFKLINDAYGHHEGDELLKQFAHRIRDCLRVGDTLSRQGGDEFTVLLPDAQDLATIESIAAKMLGALQLPFVVAGKEFSATASIGLTIYPDSGTSADELLRNSDIAMYQSKVRCKNGYLSFTPEMSRDYLERLDLDKHLREALDRCQFELHYQPQVSVSQNRVIGFEALVRWRHPVRGLIGPGSFIPVAEESGLIIALSDWVLGEACRQMAAWKRSGFEGFKMAVNVSAIEFEHANFVERIIAPIVRHRIEPGQIEIEITESLLMNDAELIIDKVRQLRESGVRVSIDDFGTRYSSLNYLRRFSVNTVKIDQAFVRDLQHSDDPSPVISAIVAIARGFDLEVIAEGVETPVQMQALVNLGCDHMQGMHFSSPRPATELWSFLTRQS